MAGLLALMLLTEPGGRPGPPPTARSSAGRAGPHPLGRGPRAGLVLLATLEGDERMPQNHRLESVRAHLLELAGAPEAARESFRRAAGMTASLPEQHYLALRAARLE